MPKPKFYGYREERKALSRRWRRQRDVVESAQEVDMGLASSGDKGAHKASPGDARATQFTPDPRSETENAGGMPSTRADSTETKPTPSATVRKDDPDPYSVA